MHSSRIATFLLGLWLGASLLVDWGAIQAADRVDAVMRSPVPGAAAIINSAGAAPARLLLAHLAAEQNRHAIETWEAVQIPLALALAVVLYFATEKRPLPIILGGFMFALVMVQYVAITPELSYRGRETDFPPAASAGEREDGGVRGIPSSDSIQTLTALFIFTEAAKVATGGVLASYLFYMRTRKRKRKDEDIEEIAKAAALRAGQSSS